MNSATARRESAIEALELLPRKKPAARAFVTWDITIHDDPAALEAVWRNLEEQGCCTAFQTYDWVSCWCETARAGGLARPLIVTVSEKGGGIAWILPLCLYNKGGTRIISLTDCGLSDYVAPVMSRNAPRDPGSARSIMRAVLKALPPCDVVHFQKIPGKAGLAGNPLAALPGLRAFHAGHHGIRLSEPWPALSAKTMQSRLRSTLLRKRRELEDEGPVAFEHHDRAETLLPALDRLMALRKSRFEAIRRPDLPEQWLNFYRTLAGRRKQSLGLGISTLTVKGEEIAMCFGMTLGKTYYAILPTFRMGKWESWRPGLLLFIEMLTHFSRKGEKEYFDFTVGDESYKDRFGCDHHPLYEWMLPRSFRGLVVYCAWQAKETLRSRPRLFAALKKISAFLRPGARNPFRTPA